MVELVKGKSSSHRRTSKNVGYDDYDPNFERRLYLITRLYDIIFFPAQVELAFTDAMPRASYSKGFRMSLSLYPEHEARQCLM